MPVERDLRFLLLGGLLLVCVLKRRRLRGGLEDQDRPVNEGTGFWEAFRKEFASSLDKASAAIGVSLGAIILSSLGGS